MKNFIKVISLLLFSFVSCHYFVVKYELTQNDTLVPLLWQEENKFYIFEIYWDTFRTIKKIKKDTTISKKSKKKIERKNKKKKIKKRKKKKKEKIIKTFETNFLNLVLFFSDTSETKKEEFWKNLFKKETEIKKAKKIKEEMEKADVVIFKDYRGFEQTFWEIFKEIFYHKENKKFKKFLRIFSKKHLPYILEKNSITFEKIPYRKKFLTSFELKHYQDKKGVYIIPVIKNFEIKIEKKKKAKANLQLKFLIYKPSYRIDRFIDTFNITVEKKFKIKDKKTISKVKKIFNEIDYLTYQALWEFFKKIMPYYKVK